MESIEKKKISNKSESITQHQQQQQSYKYYYCYDEFSTQEEHLRYYYCYDEFSTQEEHLRYSIDLHPDKIVQPKDNQRFEILGIQPKGNSWEKL